MKFENFKAEAARSITPAERRYRSACKVLRGAGRAAMSKEQQEDAAYLINKIETFGFTFFPNHYIYDDIVALEKIATDVSTSSKP